MSEIQNKAVALAVQGEGDLARLAAAHRGARFLEKALDLYFTLGGDQATAVALAGAERPAGRLRIDSAVASVMIEVAVASHLNDIDMVQATYNRFDAELQTAQRA